MKTRRVYVFRPTERLKLAAEIILDNDVRGAILETKVIMTEELAFEQFIEGYRISIYDAFKREVIGYIYGKNKIEDIPDVFLEKLGNETEIFNNFSEWWIIEEADYIELETKIWRK